MRRYSDSLQARQGSVWPSVSQSVQNVSSSWHLRERYKVYARFPVLGFYRVKFHHILSMTIKKKIHTVSHPRSSGSSSMYLRFHSSQSQDASNTMKASILLTNALSLISVLSVPYDDSISSPGRRFVPWIIFGGGSGGRKKKTPSKGDPYDAEYGAKFILDTEPLILISVKKYNKSLVILMVSSPSKEVIQGTAEMVFGGDHQAGLNRMAYGDKMPWHADGQAYHQEASPGSGSMGYGNVGQSKMKDQRDRALHDLPAGYGRSIHRDENPGASMDWMNLTLRKNSPYGYNPKREDTTNVPVPTGESATQSKVMNVAKNLIAKNGYPKEVINNRSSKTSGVKVKPNRGPYLPNDNNGRGNHVIQQKRTPATTVARPSVTRSTTSTLRSRPPQSTPPSINNRNTSSTFWRTKP